METGKKNLFNALMRFSGEIAGDGVVEHNKRSWASLEVSQYGTHWQYNGMLFTGNTGVSLFFHELYAFTGDAAFLEISRQGMNWVEDYLKTCRVNHPAFYIGNGGIAYAYLRLFESTGDKRYCALALALLDKRSSQVSNAALPADLLSGHAGIVICLLYAHALTNDPDVLDRLSTHVFYLLDTALTDHQGVKWGYKEKNINSLCGLSHGASGVGYAFLLLARYFGNASWCWMAGQAFAYERQYYAYSINNWLDLRLLDSPEAALRAFRDHDLSYFFQGNDSNAWSHGAAGIGLVRLRGYQYTKNKEWLDEGMRAIDKCIATDISGTHVRNYSLSNGKAGVAELFLEAYRVLGDQQYLDYAFQLAGETVAIYETTGQYAVGLKNGRYDNGLFMGRTGLAYLLLRVLNNNEPESVLLPGSRALALGHGSVKDHILATLTEAELQRRIFQRHGKTPAVHRDAQPMRLFGNPGPKLAEADVLTSTARAYKAQAIAQGAWTLLQENRSYRYSATREKLAAEQNQKASILNEQQFRCLKLQVSPVVFVIPSIPGGEMDEGCKAVLLKRIGNTVIDLELSLLSEMILRHTYAGITVSILITLVLQDLEPDIVGHPPTGETNIVLQIRNLIVAGFLEAGG